MREVDESELQAIIDAMPLMFFQKDTDNRMVRANRAAAIARGVTVEMLVGTAASEWYPDMAESYRESDQKVIASRQPLLGILEQTLLPDGTKVWTEVDKWPKFGPDGEVEGVLVFVRDATGEAAAREALRQSEAHLRAILASEPECVKVLDADGCLVEMNPAGLRMVEADALDDVVGVSVYDFLRPEYHDDHRELHRRVLRGGSGRMEYEIVGLRGTERWIETHAAHLDNGEHGFLAISRDITEAKRAEHERESLRAQLRHAQRLEGIGLLAGGVAHDFNNHLMVIAGRTELALADLETGHPARVHLASILNTARQAANVCDQLLTYAGKRTLDREPTDITDLLAGMDELLRVTASKRVDLRFQLAHHLPAAVVDRIQLSQVIVNLVANAADALQGRQGTIVVTTGISDGKAPTAPRPLAAPGEEPASYVFVSVTDTGSGMDRATQDKMFDPFFTTKADGRGLGLATVLGTIRGHDGAIEVDSAPGRGTTVTVHLPATTQEAPREVDLRQTASAVTPDQKTILVVDDEVPVRTVLASTLERYGFDVIEAAGGPEAIDHFRSEPGGIDAVVLDMTMPDMDGPQVYAELARIDATIPVLFSSGYPQQEVIDRLGGLDQVAFLQKPYSASELVEALQELVQVRPGRHATR